MSYQLSTNKNTEIIHIDSKNLVTNSTTGFSEIEFYLNSVIDLSDNYDVAISVDSFEIALPYNINNDCNQQYFQYNCTGISASDCLISMPEGNYILDNVSLSNNLASELQHTLLTEIQKNTGITTEFDTMSVDYSDLTGKITISSDVGNNCVISASTSSNNTLLPFLGFREDDTVSASSTFVSNYPISMINPRMIYINTDLPISPQIDSRENFRHKQILQKIPNTTIGGSVLTFIDTGRASNRHIIKSNFISKMKIWLTDENNRRIDLQGLYFSMTLKLEKVIQQQNVYNRNRSLQHDYLMNNNTIQKTQYIPTFQSGSAIL